MDSRRFWRQIEKLILGCLIEGGDTATVALAGLKLHYSASLAFMLHLALGPGPIVLSAWLTRVVMQPLLFGVLAVVLNPAPLSLLLRLCRLVVSPGLLVHGLLVRGSTLRDHFARAGLVAFCLFALLDWYPESAVCPGIRGPRLQSRNCDWVPC